MRELVVRSLLHRVAAGDESDLVVAALLAPEMETSMQLAGIQV